MALIGPNGHRQAKHPYPPRLFVVVDVFPDCEQIAFRAHADINDIESDRRGEVGAVYELVQVGAVHVDKRVTITG